MTTYRNRDGRDALAAILVACAAAAAVMMIPWDGLGARERMALAAVAGIVAALAVVAAIVVRRWIAGRIDEFEPAEEAPALRRHDSHPDAPPRRPIFAVADLGLPEEPQSIPDLLARFERGLERRMARGPRPEDADGEASEPPADVDDALRDALGTLRQMASRVQ